MRRIKEILRLRLDKGLGIRQIARSCKVSHSTVSGLVTKAEQSRLTWEQVQHIDESVLEAMFYPQTEEQKAAKRPEPDPEWIHRELRKSKNVTLQLLWEEYKREHPEGLQYSQFCARYANGGAGWTFPCDKSMSPAKSCLSISAARKSRLSTL
jgi:transcriptional regulator with XRE-family HTH domain